MPRYDKSQAVPVPLMISNRAKVEEVGDLHSNNVRPWNHQLLLYKHRLTPST